ncbi:hypothetical protein BZA05DRAFT_402234 [Tricharina praecox]|uniref:uncharacterized protein n=1 Tax=Tricharina praecox TaxID=43433 RepID=UPI00221FAB80|nr:uncharacterized protein BZA05DRAFT_402234 [Tricharina praecox]KAI5849112.1 hypothetical protein BZA05DRAFT_402234 [Tricharina praecox]
MSYNNYGEAPQQQQQSWGGYVRAAARYATSTASSTTADGQPREPGARRRKLIQAASELKQSYYAGYRSNNVSGENLPETGVVTADNMELWLFPSYARELSGEERRRKDVNEEPAFANYDEFYHGDLDYGEEDNVCEVDVRGWLFASRSGPLGRKDRWQMSVVRWMCGLSSQAPSQSEDSDGPPLQSSSASIRSEAGSEGGGSWRSALWRSNPAQEPQPTMTPAELRAANLAFDERLAPFTHQAIPRTPVTIIFYNNTNNTQAHEHTLYTSENGHFSVRERLSFVPTHAVVRVLASQTLSITEEVKMHSAEGISLISDIDDTVKHSGIGIGPREMARAAFTMPVRDVMVPGVGDWYKTLASPPYNVSVHYISNSPWQLYPVLRSFFSEAGLPPGSFHLKHYNGMFQGVFEPAADRKRGTVERVMLDFPSRKWLLVGDSGEADLEVYTEMAERWPDRVIAVCIRDVTSHLTRDYSVFAGEPTQPGSNLMSFDGNNSSGTLQRPSPLRDDWAEDESPLPNPRPIPRPSPHRNDASTCSSNSSTSTLSIRNSTPPSRPEKPPSLRSPPVPKKPTALQQHHSTPNAILQSAQDAQATSSRGTVPPPPPPPRRSTISAEPLPPPLPPRRDTSHDVRAGLPLRRVITANPALEEVRTAAPPRLQHRVATATGISAGTDLPQLTKRQIEWERRWAVARERLDRINVRLLYWRVGTDLKDITVGLVEKELRGTVGRKE